ncbi:FAD-dependent monooxygenase [Barrientosiimonas marina]|uniref:FAD-dependent monooxygenase n=1 Tax=Lentibacillus kimchii TaxID=1542911 RepID=A0ABW2UU15_9BACI
MRLAIIGGGIGGLALAAGLHKKGIKAHVFEKTQAFKPLGAGLGLGANAVLALDRMGIADAIEQAGMPLQEQRLLNDELTVMNRIDFSRLKKRYGKETLTIHRADLHEALYNAVDPDYFHFNKQVIDFNQYEDQVTLTFQDNVTETFDYVIAAEGIHSVFRRALVPGSEPRFAGYTCWRGIAWNKGDVPYYTSSEAWSGRGRFGWAPLYDGRVYWFACVNTQANNEYYANLTKEGTARLFGHFSPTAERLIRETESGSFLHHDIHDIKPLDSFVYGRIALVGDAAHATTPNMGQGAGQSIEDAYELMNAISQESSMPAALSRYEAKRLKKANKVIKLSRQIGWAAQWQHPLATGFRNTVLPLVPESLLFRRLMFLFK